MKYGKRERPKYAKICKAERELRSFFLIKTHSAALTGASPRPLYVLSTTHVNDWPQSYDASRDTAVRRPVQYFSCNRHCDATCVSSSSRLALI